MSVSFVYSIATAPMPSSATSRNLRPHDQYLCGRHYTVPDGPRSATRAPIRCFDCVADGDCAMPDFCNGAETCGTSQPHTCMAGTTPCQPGDICDETDDVCVDCQTDTDPRRNTRLYGPLPNDPTKIAPGICGCGVPEPTSMATASTPARADCDDGNAAVFPGALEVCDDGQDNDCDGLTDLDDNDCSGDQPAAGTVFDVCSAPPTFSWRSNVSGRFKLKFALNPEFQGRKVLSPREWIVDTTWTPDERTWRRILGLPDDGPTDIFGRSSSTAGALSRTMSPMTALRTCSTPRPARARPTARHRHGSSAVFFHGVCSGIAHLDASRARGGVLRARGSARFRVDAGAVQTRSSD